MELQNPKRELMPGVVSDTDLAAAVNKLREAETKQAAFWAGVRDALVEFNEDVRAGRH